MEFALWVLHDVQAIGAFEAARGKEALFYVAGSAGPLEDGEGERESGGESGREREGIPQIHPVVTSTIAALRNDPRCAGSTGFGDFIDLIERDLLQIDVEQRAEAGVVAGRLGCIVQSVESGERCLFNDVVEEPVRLKLRFGRAEEGG